ncbi:hypothetical protein NQ314_001318 [Rhamnusium bicolor]|uniref:DUF5641 domain-containing protein n=1 Tax=Rhamnusium bicolor TaxID=1586634 RepID=A0AAV8ZSV3_9CUCU|nr:hypothetical protein NQ314_001318 [Rhamnusium bicolor]
MKNLKVLHRIKWKQKHQGVTKVGAMVVILRENSHPLHWSLDRIIATHPGDDGIIQIVSVKTANGTIKCAVNFKFISCHI